ncbi:MAG: efflux RND transporter periplasmic adaptor subunit [Proteobacteria bacterium]|nr:efflux RND transporter periplasmic adaptor subunit [Pseudomonadota bacterium]MBU1641051.1 efflux RND transporter periplasmic adaptor subunit [Pseudomonadota bacterium]
MKHRTPILATIIIALALGAMAALYFFRPTTSKIKPQAIVPLVSVREIVPSSEKVFIEAFGTVIPARQVELFAEVEGRIVEQNQELVPGGVLRDHSFLVQIDPRAYQFIVRERKADLVEAETKLALEKGQQNIASREWQLFNEEKDRAQVSERLALREPHLKSALAQVEAAASRLASAELDVQRTKVTAPFNALILEEYVEKGQLIGRQTPIAKLVETDYFWIQVSVSLADLSRITFADQNNPQGSAVEVILETENGGAVVRKATVFKLLGDLDPKGRMARILVSVKDPLNLQEPASTGKILLGSYVKVRIEAGVMDGVYVIPREAIRENDRLWVLTTDNTLAIRQTTVKWRRKDELLVSVDMGPGEKVIISRLQSPLPGMALRIESGNASAGQGL